MNKQMLKFYADKNLQVSKMIEKRPAGITPVQVEAAATQLYESMLSGVEVVKDIRIAWRVWEIARTINAVEYEERVAKLLGYEEITDALQEQVGVQKKQIRRLKIGGWCWVTIYWAIAIWFIIKAWG